MSRSITLLLSLAALLSGLLPVYNAYILRPALVESLSQESANDAKRFGRLLFSLLAEKHALDFNAGLMSEQISLLRQMQHQQELVKIRMFSSQGTITFSTKTAEVGSVNSHPYFHEEVAKGKSYSKLVVKNGTSREGQVLPLDVVETYIPYMESDRFMGAFELYYDVTAQVAQIRSDLGRFSHVLMLFSLLNILVLSLVTIRARRAFAVKIKAEQRIKKIAYFDPLTGLPNRNSGYQRLTTVLDDACCQQQKTAVLFIDLDHFKKTNDQWGYRYGDELMKGVARRLYTYVGQENFVARLGSDQFMIILSHIHTQADAECCAQQLLDNLRRPYFVFGKELSLSASIGIVLSPEHGEDVDTLQKHSDITITQVKDAGRDHYQTFTLELYQEIQSRHRLREQLQQAVRRNEFYLLYQPQVDLKTLEIVGCEVLLRWQNAEFGNVPPDRFIPMAEESGIIDHIGDWVLREACAQLKVWQDKGFTALRMGVNLSGHQIRQVDFVKQVADAIAQTRIDSGMLELELTESIFMENIDDNIESLVSLKRLGISLALDDFGTGYSSLQYMRDFPFDRLKIDRSFVWDITTGEKGAAIVDTIIAMTKTLGLMVIAEGIENADQRKVLQWLGCHEGQGYLFGKPMEADQFECHLVKPRKSLQVGFESVARAS